MRDNLVAGTWRSQKRRLGSCFVSRRRTTCFSWDGLACLCRQVYIALHRVTEMAGRCRLAYLPTPGTTDSDTRYPGQAEDKERAPLFVYTTKPLPHPFGSTSPDLNESSSPARKKALNLSSGRSTDMLHKKLADNGLSLVASGFSPAFNCRPPHLQPRNLFLFPFLFSASARVTDISAFS